ncbi:hypothetical protein MN608_05047 [Microdochium nivale]|nr:hypothetical protein MN608_05047 [Microdochium nivale]
MSDSEVATLKVAAGNVSSFSAPPSSLLTASVLSGTKTVLLDDEVVSRPQEGEHDHGRGSLTTGMAPGLGPDADLESVVGPAGAVPSEDASLVSAMTTTAAATMEEICRSVGRTAGSSTANTTTNNSTIKTYSTRRERRRIVEWMGAVHNICCVCSTPQPGKDTRASAMENISSDNNSKSNSSFGTSAQAVGDEIRDGASDGGSGAWRIKVCSTCGHPMDPSISIDGLVCKTITTMTMTGRGGRLLCSTSSVFSKVGKAVGLGRQPLAQKQQHSTTADVTRSLPATQDAAATRPCAIDNMSEQNRQCSCALKKGSAGVEDDSDGSTERSVDTLAWLSGDDSSRGGNKGKPGLDLDEKAARLRRAQKLLGKSAAA